MPTVYTVRTSDQDPATRAWAYVEPPVLVEDDGRGGPVREGSGLAGMRERAERVGGEMAIDTARGVTLTVRISAVPERPTSEQPASREAAA